MECSSVSIDKHRAMLSHLKEQLGDIRTALRAVESSKSTDTSQKWVNPVVGTCLLLVLAGIVLMRMPSTRKLWRKVSTSASRYIQNVVHAKYQAELNQRQEAQRRWLGDGMKIDCDNLKALQDFAAYRKGEDFSVETDIGQAVQELNSSLIQMLRASGDTQAINQMELGEGCLAIDVMATKVCSLISSVSAEDPRSSVYGDFLSLWVSTVQKLEDIEKTHPWLLNLDHVRKNLCVKVLRPKNHNLKIWSEFIDPLAVETLDASGCGIYDVPDAVNCMRNLQTLVLDNNHIRKISGLNLPRLRSIRANNNMIECIKDCMFGELTSFKADKNNFSEIPALGPSLTELSLRNNKITVIQADVAEMRSLQVLDLSGNSLQEISPELAGLRQLQELNVYGADINVLPCELRDMSCLGKLVVGGYDMRESAPSQETIDIVQAMAGLKSLDVCDSNLSTFPEWVTRMENLTSLRISGGQIDSVPDDISRMANLVELDMQNQSLQEIPRGILRMRGLRDLHLGSNQIGVIPDGIGDMESLRRLNMAKNAVTGISEKTWTLENLEGLAYGDDKMLAKRDIDAIGRNVHRLHSSILRELQSSGNALAIYKRDLDLDEPTIEAITDRISTLVDSISADDKGMAMCSRLCEMWVGVVGELAAIEKRFPELVNLDGLSNRLHAKSLKLGREDCPDRLLSLVESTTVEALDLSSCGLPEVPSAVQRMKNLRRLVLDNNALQKIELELPNLGFLSANDNDLRELNLCGFPKLVELHADGNRLIDVPSGMQTVRRLSLARNRIQTIYQQHPGLESIDLSYNPLSTFIGDMVPDLKELRMHGVGVGILAHNSCREVLKKLEVLSVGGYEIEKDMNTFGRLFTGMENLQVLCMVESNLEKLPSWISEKSGLREMVVTGGKIRNVDNLNWANLTSLKRLDLRRQALKEVPIVRNKCISEMCLDDNKITDVSEVLKKRGMGTLKTLSVKRNLVKKIPGSIEGMSNLNRLDLDGNLIDMIPMEIINLSGLKYLSLRNNKISGIHNMLIHNIKVSFDEDKRCMDLRGNPIDEENYLSTCGRREIRNKFGSHVLVD